MMAQKTGYHFFLCHDQQPIARWNDALGFNCDSDGKDNLGTNTEMMDPTSEEGMNVETVTDENRMLTQQLKNSTSLKRGGGKNFLICRFQTLAQPAAGTKFKTIVAGISIQVNKDVEYGTNIDIWTGSWDSVVARMTATIEHYKNAFSGRDSNILGNSGVPNSGPASTARSAQTKKGVVKNVKIHAAAAAGKEMEKFLANLRVLWFQGTSATDRLSLGVWPWQKDN